MVLLLNLRIIPILVSTITQSCYLVSAQSCTGTASDFNISNYMPDTNTLGGVLQVGVTQWADCAVACIRSQSCTGFDWDSNSVTNSYCWLSLTNTTAYSYGVQHYTSSCNGFLTPNSSCSWNVSINSGSSGTLVSSYKYLINCLSGCLKTNLSTPGQCLGVDWNTIEQTCWFTYSKDVSYGTRQNVNHYNVVCNATSGYNRIVHSGHSEIMAASLILTAIYILTKLTF